MIALDLNRPTKDITEAPAMSEAECLDALGQGAEAVDRAADILILGEMGIGNSTIAAALSQAVFGGAPANWVGRGTGLDVAGIARKARVVARAVERHLAWEEMQILAALGGREQAAICGAVLAARAARIPVILDGFICTAATAPIFVTNRELLAYCLVGHVSAESGHRPLLSAMGCARSSISAWRLARGRVLRWR